MSQEIENKVTVPVELSDDDQETLAALGSYGLSVEDSIQLGLKLKVLIHETQKAGGRILVESEGNLIQRSLGIRKITEPDLQHTLYDPRNEGDPFSWPTRNEDKSRAASPYWLETTEEIK